MESLAPTFIINRKWLLCILASFTASILLTYIFQTPKTITTSLHNHHFPLFSPLIPHNTSSTSAPVPSPNPSSTSQFDAISPPFPPASEQQDSVVLSLPPAQNPILLLQKQGPESSTSLNVSDDVHKKQRCDIFDGKWVYDSKGYPLYRAHWCPFLDDQVRCQRNGRPDYMYEQWRWQPNGCDIPRFDGRNVLEKWRGKRVVIVGDSLNRNMWESLACLLFSTVRRKRAYVKVVRSDYKIFKALDYDCVVEFYWSPFLVELKERKDGAKILRLDKMPVSARQWQGADIMIFNTGHWWTHNGNLRAWNFFELRGQLVEGMNEKEAFSVALRTWEQWLDRYVDPTKTTVVFRSISPQHKRTSLHWCYNQTRPIAAEPYIETFPDSMVSLVEQTIRRTKTPVKYLNITRLSEFRRDAHTSVYTVRGGKLLTHEERRQPQQYADCSHWCLPGLPDTWNVLLFAFVTGAVDTVS